MNIRGEVSSKIKLFDVPAPIKSRLEHALQFPNPVLKKYAILKQDPPKWIKEFVSCIDENELEKSLTIPRGAITILKKIVQDKCTAIEWIDLRETGKNINFNIKNNIKLRPYQQEALDGAIQKIQGTIVLPCGTGKTTLGVSIIEKLKIKTLVVVPTKDLAEQWIGYVETNLTTNVGLVGDGKKNFCDVTVSIVDSLINTEYETIIRERFGLVIFDEAHHTPANKFQNALDMLPAKYRIGLTATPIREDGMTPLFDWSFGNRIYERNISQLALDGYIVLPKVIIVKTGFSYEKQETDFRSLSKLAKAIVKNKNRNKIICDIAKKEYEKGQTILVLSNRKDHCKILHTMLENEGVHSKVLTSTSSTKLQRSTSINQMRSGELRIIIATSLADEGLDIHRLSRVILAFPERSRSRTVQRLGRLTRVFGNKKPILYDIVDSKQKTLLNRFEERKRTYRSLGLEIESENLFI